MVRRTNSLNVRVKIGRWASAPTHRLTSYTMMMILVMMRMQIRDVIIPSVSNRDLLVGFFSGLSVLLYF